ncbi:unnamed protein product [Caenorhabditis sp. 36 PRJEB53466]|nr:unnamed protein product [Caenorhabditis sp. 36 PRJEB53466]
MHSKLICTKYIIEHGQTNFDFDNAHILGAPQVLCSPKSIAVIFSTSMPFQGRISVYDKFFIPACKHEYAANILNNASFVIDVLQCAETGFLKNGSRIIKAYVEIGFHPLVITNSDRMFLVECVDNSVAPIVNISPEATICKHLVRIASEWNSMTEFHVGDAIVHEWSCQLPDPENTQTFLTNCNALSQSGHIIHLVDKDGCVVDAELMGDVVYSNHVSKLYARARTFKFLSDEKYRIECNLEFCSTNSTCKDRPFPPKCAFTKEEISSRFNRSKVDEFGITVMPGNLNNAFDTSIKVSSAWLTVKFNQYTEFKNLHKRYHLKAYLDNSIEIFHHFPVAEHFLMDISYRGPLLNAKPSTVGSDRTVVSRVLHSTVFQPVFSQPISSNEDLIETITFGNSLIPDRSAKKLASTTTESNTKQSIKKLNFITTSDPVQTTTDSSKSGPVRILTTVAPKKETSKRKTSELETALTTPIPLNKLVLSTLSPKKKLTPTTPYIGISATTTHEPRVSQSVSQNTINVSQSVGEDNVIHKQYDKFVFNSPDWRFDEKAINDSDTVLERQNTACFNATIISKQCKWSGVEHLLLIWSFSSLLIWMLLIASFLYKQLSKKPQWTDFRKKQLKEATQSRILNQDHPWLHADAFEEPNQNKHGVKINRFS